jgi:phage/plasmid-related protein TIGR03299
MAHELEFQNGVASMFSVRETPWHRFGHVLNDAPSYDEAIKLARLDYHVEKRPTFFNVPTEDGQDTFLRKSDKAFVTVRTDTQKELGSVGPDYEPVQNLDAFRIFEPLLDQGVLVLETGGVLRDGADAWLMGKWDLSKFGPITREVFGSEIVPYALLACNHAGKRGVLVQKTNIRVVCANTLGFAESSNEERIVVRHSGDALERLVEAAEGLFLNFVEEYETLSLQYKALKEFRLTQEMFDALVVKPVVQDPRERKGWNPEARMANTVIERYDIKVREINRLWSEGDGHTGDGSAWEAYNGVVQALDHNEDLWPARSGVYRTQKLLGGDLATMKNSVLNNLVAVAVR